MAAHGTTVAEYPTLMRIKPRERLVFHSDYWRVDERFATILMFVHESAAQDDFGAFWGVNRVGYGLGTDVTAVLLDQISRRGEHWVDEHLKSAESVSGLAAREAASGSSTAKSRNKATRAGHDIEEIAAEIVNGASYLEVHARMMLISPSLDALDLAVSKLERLYVDRFGTLSLGARHGRQRAELSSLLVPNAAKPGFSQGYTSTELAGSYSLVTNGLADPTGEYVGFMLGDVNTSAVLFDVGDFTNRVVAAAGLTEVAYPDQRTQLVAGAGLWGVKVSQSALVSGNRAVHVVLDGFPVAALGDDLSSLTSTIEMTRGEVNPLELFGRVEDELGLFPMHLDKLGLMVDQLYPLAEAERSIVRSQLREILVQFYVDKDMWRRDARANRHQLRLVGLQHRQVPVLHDLTTYFESEYEKLANRRARDEEAMHAVSVLRGVFRDMLDSHGGLFDNTTAASFDRRDSSPRVIYELSGLASRGQGVMMAQLLNVIATAVAGLGQGDVLVLHGCERIEERVKPYLMQVMNDLRVRGGRVALLYRDTTAMLADVEVNRFESADWTIFGGMTALELNSYQERLGMEMPPDLQKLVEGATDRVHLRRGHVNVVFRPDLRLGPHESRQEA